MPGYFDLQINGCFGVDFNSSSLSEQDWLAACRNLSLTGTSHFLPTIITDAPHQMLKKIQRLVELSVRSNRFSSAEYAKAVGIHVEGPFISSTSGYVGAHPAPFAIPSDLELAKRIVDAGQGTVRIMTIAPEQDMTGELIRYMSDQDCAVFAGHTNASYDDLVRGLDSGLVGFTHLGNGCPPVLPRHDNILNRVLCLRDSFQCITLIADGYHLPPWLLKSWIEWFGVDRTIIISDAISAAGLGPGLHQLGDQSVFVGEDGVPRSPDASHFVGSGATLDKMHELLKTQNWSLEAQSKLLVQNARNIIRF